MVDLLAYLEGHALTRRRLFPRLESLSDHAGDALADVLGGIVVTNEAQRHPQPTLYLLCSDAANGEAHSTWITAELNVDTFPHSVQTPRE